MNRKILYNEIVSIRTPPVNLDTADLRLFEHEFEKTIAETVLLELKNVGVRPDGTVFRGGDVLPESLPRLRFRLIGKPLKSRLKFFVKNCLLEPGSRIDETVFMFSDIWSQEYFHWMTDALPRLFAVREQVKDAPLLLPGAFERREFVSGSLKPFGVQNIRFLRENARCKNLVMASHTAPTGNYNDGLIREMSDFLRSYYQNQSNFDSRGDKIYISRAKAGKRKILNEAECVRVLQRYGFETVCFEDHPFEQQARIALGAKYLVSNHGAGLTNMLFMPAGSTVLELRKRADAHNNCYFSLASALKLKYFYQLCDSDAPDESPHTANTFVDCRLLEKNVEQMLAA